MTEERPEHDKLADDLEHQADRLEADSERVEHEIDDTRKDWERKRRDPDVPGAPPPEDDES